MSSYEENYDSNSESRDYSFENTSDSSDELEWNSASFDIGGDDFEFDNGEFGEKNDDTSEDGFEWNKDNFDIGSDDFEFDNKEGTSDIYDREFDFASPLLDSENSEIEGSDKAAKPDANDNEKIHETSESDTYEDEENINAKVEAHESTDTTDYKDISAANKHTFSDWIDPKNYTNDSRYVGEKSEWGYKPELNGENVDAADYNVHISEGQEQRAALTAYMYEHNYSKGDYPNYSQDPEWRYLVKNAFPETELPKLSEERAAENMRNYYYDRNLTSADEANYTKDPQWQMLYKDLYGEDFVKHEEQKELTENTPASFETEMTEDTEDHEGFVRSLGSWFASLFGAEKNYDTSENEWSEIDDDLEEIGELDEPIEEVFDINEVNEEAPAEEISKTEISEDNEGVESLEQIFVEKIEKMDYNDLTEDDKIYIYESVSEYIIDKNDMYVTPEKLEGFENKISLVSTEACRQAYEENGSPYPDDVLGFYRPSDDKIFIDIDRNGDKGGMTEILATVVHEMMHKAGNSAESSCGGMYSDEIEGIEYHECLNIDEGFTELFAIEDTNAMGLKYESSSYEYQVSVARELENVFGKDFVREAYLTNCPEKLQVEFDKAFLTQEQLDTRKLGETVTNKNYVNFIKSLNGYVSTGQLVYKDEVEQYLAELKNRRSNNGAKQN